MRAAPGINPLIIHAIGPDGRELKHFRNKRLKAVASKLSRFEHLDMKVRFVCAGEPFDCRLVIHPNVRKDDTPRYLVTNLEPEAFTPQHVSDGYRLRWQVELLFKEWKSYANLHAFDTSNPHIAEGLIWASLCAATVKRYCAHMTQRVFNVAMSTQTVAKCIHHVLGDVLAALMHDPRRVYRRVKRALTYLASNAQRFPIVDRPGVTVNASPNLALSIDGREFDLTGAHRTASTTADRLTSRIAVWDWVEQGVLRQHSATICRLTLTWATWSRRVCAIA